MPLAADALRLARPAIDLEAAATRRTDTAVLPPRTDGELSPECRRALGRRLAERLDAGEHRPRLAHVVRSPKRGGTRVVAVLHRDDAWLYSALLSALRPTVTAPISRHSLYGLDDGGYPAFQDAVLATDPNAVACADIAGYAGSLDRDRLAAQLLDLGGDHALVDALAALLAVTLPGGRGVPFLLATRVVTTVALDPLDSALTADGLAVFRLADDIRVPVPDRQTGEAVLERIAAEAAAIGLSVNPDKGAIVDGRDFRRRAEDLHAFGERFTPGWRRRALRSTAARAALRAELADEPEWVDDTAVTFRLRRALTALSRAHSPLALPLVGPLLERFPGEAQPLTGHVGALAATRHRTAAIDTAMALLDPAPADPVLRAWLLAALRPAGPALPRAAVDLAQATATEAGLEWLTRVEALRVLHAAGRLDPALAAEARAEAPPALEGDLDALEPLGAP